MLTNMLMNVYTAPIILPTGVIVYPGYMLDTTFKKSVAYPMYDDISVVIKMHAAHSIPLASAKDFGLDLEIVFFDFWV